MAAESSSFIDSFVRIVCCVDVKLSLELSSEEALPLTFEKKESFASIPKLLDFEHHPNRNSTMTGLAKGFQAQEDTESPRYDPSIYSTPFSELPDSKRVWLGTPGSALEGLGSPPPFFSLPGPLSFYITRLPYQDGFPS